MSGQESYWEHAPHDADMIIRGVGADVGQAFEQAASAMTALITDEAIEAETCIDIACSAPDQEILLTEWLNRIVYEMSSGGMIFGRFAIEEISATHLVGKAWGEPIEQTRHQPVVEVKGATLSELNVSQQSDGKWIAQCVVDI